MTHSPFLSRKFKTKAQPLIPATISDFSGGLNNADNDVTMKTKYSKVLTNWQKTQDGSHAVRWGTAFKWNIGLVVTGSLIAVQYFARNLVCFTTTGQICSITEQGVMTKIWDTGIAAALPGAPGGWSAGLEIGSIDTTEFKGELIVQNGIDKPIILSKLLVVTYLQDLATGSNVNTPIGKYVRTVANYVVIAGITADKGSVWVSSAGTSGVFVGDPAPNDGITFNLASYVPQNSAEIIGLGSFRNFLLVFFEGAVVVVEMGTYTAAVHTPAVQDNIVEHGVINHLTTVVTKNDFFMADMLGWHRATRNQFGLIDTVGISELIDDNYQSTTPFEVADRKLAFTVWNALENRIMLQTQIGTDRHWWVMSYEKENSKNISWTHFDGWSWTCACKSEKGRIFFGLGTKIYQYGNDVFPSENWTADRVNDYDFTWVTATNYSVGDRILHDGAVYVTLLDHTSGVFIDDYEADRIELHLGDSIDFDWELPWTDINKRAQKKQLRYIMADTQGTATFDISVYVDNYYKDENDDYDPALTMTFVAGDSEGYGGSPEQPYGGGRRLRDERPWGMPSDFKIMKLRIHGSTKHALRIITITILYLIGSFRR